MRAIVNPPGQPGVLELREVALPEPGPGQARVAIRASAVNRADLLQVMGMYPAPADAPPDIPGLELAGVVDAVGAGVVDVKEGDRVMALASGGAYAEAVVLHARALAPIPGGLSFAEAAAIPEAFLTAYDAMVLQANLAAGESVLVHAVGSGVGTAAIQIARAIGATAIGTARTADKLERAAPLGLAHGIVQEGKAPRFAERVKQLTGGRGADVVLELVGGDYVPESLAALGERGRLALVGLVAGVRADVDLAMLLRRRLHVFGTALRSRPLEEKLAVSRVLARNLVPLFERGALVPVVGKTFPLARTAEAHAYVASNQSFGKVVLAI